MLPDSTGALRKILSWRNCMVAGSHLFMRKTRKPSFLRMGSVSYHVFPPFHSTNIRKPRYVSAPWSLPRCNQQLEQEQELVAQLVQVIKSMSYCVVQSLAPRRLHRRAFQKLLRLSSIGARTRHNARTTAVSWWFIISKCWWGIHNARVKWLGFRCWCQGGLIARVKKVVLGVTMWDLYTNDTRFIF